MSGAGERSALRRAIVAAHRGDEAVAMGDLLAQIGFAPQALADIRQRAMTLVAAVRQERAAASGVDLLMQEFSLSSQEGVALMCLAESLLRIPDRETVDRLIRDKLSRGDWSAHLGHSDSLFVNAAAWGLLITRKLVATNSSHGLSGALSRIIARGGEPLVRAALDLAMRLLGQQFVLGQSIGAALKRSRDREAQGYRYSYDMLGEAALTAADAARYLAAYEQAIGAIGQAAAGRGVHASPGISVKLSALHPRYLRSQRARVLAELLPRLKRLCALARDCGIGLNIDAEESERLDLSLDLLEALALDADLAGWDGLGFVVQAYQKRASAVIDYLLDLARRSGHRLMLRLVKGAYWDAEIKRAQVDGVEGYPVFTRKRHSDVAYLACARKLLGAGAAVYPQFATHNAHSLAAVYQMAQDMGGADYEFQCLHGMGEALYDQVVGADRLDRPVRIYAPVGSHESLLPYLVRRLLENGANSSFVNRIVDASVSLEALAADPCAAVAQEGGSPHPAIPLPRDLYGATRRNSRGLDLADEETIARMEVEQAPLARHAWRAGPMLAGVATGAEGWSVQNPADRGDTVGQVVSASRQDVDTALAAAQAYAAAWARHPAEERSAMLERAAELFEAESARCISLCVREAGKTWANAAAELREAVDFCRYYARELRALGSAPPSPPGPVVCISPWNFPLAIFTGQVAAALASGHPVVAKPAEQTSLTAAFAVALLHRAGVPSAAVQLLPGRGEVVGAALVADPRAVGVLFTGSGEVALAINRAIAGREAMLIAETGGQNAMIADSTALPEQVVQDALASAFDSAGQRCSALRVLCVQEDIADGLLAMLKGAMQELTVGDPRRLETDVGPVIDAEAKEALIAHVQRMRRLGKRITEVELPASCAAGSFLAPTLIEIDALQELRGEVFGPVLHFLRYRREGLGELLAAIGATGYGLTLGVHSRIDETIDEIVAHARVGNIYVNRNMVGAVVGVQPFGGEGRSGTGPKAGGPLYLHRLLGSRRVAPEALGGRPADAEPRLVRLATWARERGDSELAGLCSAYAALSLLRVRLDLPGPTGERNTLTFAPRGRMLCQSEGRREALGQIAAVLAVGGTVVLPDGKTALSLLASLPAELVECVDLQAQEDFSDLAGVLVDGAEDAALRRRLAEQDGALIPVFQPGGEPPLYPVFRMVTERVLSVNTTAAGGNASLMSLDS